MARSVEFTNVRIFEAEVNRMPAFVLHELAHAYHDRDLPKGFGNPEIAAAFARAKESGKYDKVERHLGNGRPNTFEKAYAMTNPMEYFAETTEAYFSPQRLLPVHPRGTEEARPGRCSSCSASSGRSRPTRLPHRCRRRSRSNC